MYHRFICILAMSVLGAFNLEENMCSDDIDIFVDKVLITLKKSKTDPFQDGVTILLYANTTSISLVKAIRHYLAMKRGNFRSIHLQPFFVNDLDMSFSRTFFITTLRAVLSKSGLSVWLYNGHSFHIRLLLLLSLIKKPSYTGFGSMVF